MAKEIGKHSVNCEKLFSSGVCISLWCLALLSWFFFQVSKGHRRGLRKDRKVILEHPVTVLGNTHSFLTCASPIATRTATVRTI